MPRRYFLRLAYAGTRYHGWQRQPHSASVQETLEGVLSTICNAPVELVGCGRTDAGVHADDYAAHLDLAAAPPPDLLRRANRMLPPDIALRSLADVGPVPPPGEQGPHARFSATHRAYRYELVRDKHPFRVGLAWHYHGFRHLGLADLNAAAVTLLDYEAFAPFCKTQSDARTMRCDLRRAEWVVAAADASGPAELHFHVASDRFLRGMIRLIVGACVEHALGRLSLEDLRVSLDAQTPLPRPVSAPPDGLYLTDVRYDGLDA